MKKTPLFIVVVGTLIAGLIAFAQIPRSPSAEGTTAYFINLQDGDVLESPMIVQFGLNGMGVAPAGFDAPNSGHHHLLVNQNETEIDYGLPLPATDNIRHFGGGQTETSLELAPGEYSLQLLLGNFSHIPHDAPVLSEKITITVK